jgi:PAS domain S-box-containing protein
MRRPPLPQDFGIGRLFEHVKDAVIVADARTEEILLWNRGAEEMFGYTRDEALALPLHRLVAPDLVELHRAGLARYEEEGSGGIVDSGKAVEVKAVRKNGETFPIELTLSAVDRTEWGEGRVVLALVRDATDRKAAEGFRRVQGQQQTALEIHDTIVQGLSVAKAAFEVGESERGLEVLSKTLAKARSVVGQLMDERQTTFGLEPGDFVRSDAASLEVEEPPSK